MWVAPFEQWLGENFYFIFLKILFQSFWVHNDSRCNQLPWTEVESFEIPYFCYQISQIGIANPASKSERL